MQTELPDGWEYKKLIEVCDLNPKKSELKGSSNLLVSFVPMADMEAKQKYLVAGQKRQLNEVYTGYTYFKDGDVLLAKVTPCFENGKSGIANNLTNGIGFGSSEYYVFRPKQDVLSDYIYYVISNNKFLIEGSQNMSGAVGLKRVTKDFIQNYRIAIPSFPEQKRIVTAVETLFNKIDKSIGLLQENIDHVKKLRSSVINEVFNNNWRTKKLIDVCNIVGGGTPAKSNNSYYGGDILWATVGDMNIDFLEDTKLKINSQAVKNSATNIIPKGNLIIATRVGLGKICVLTRDSAINQDLKGIIPSRAIYSMFLFYWLQSRSDYFISKGMGATVKGFKLEILENLDVPFIPVEKQKQIANYIKRINDKSAALTFRYQSKLDELKRLKNSILESAFRGELISTNQIKASEQVMILALSVEEHKKYSTPLYRTKAEKIVHVVETHIQRDFGRTPMKMAAGPADFDHIIQVVEPLAKKNDWLEVQEEWIERNGEDILTHNYKEGNQFNSFVEKANRDLKADLPVINYIIKQFTPLTRKDAEIYSTVYGAWNNLLLRGEPVTPDTILYESRENWDIAKLKIEPEKFLEGIDWLKKKNIRPYGVGKEVIKVPA